MTGVMPARPFPLRVLCGVLLAWQPADCALALVTALNAWPVRGVPVAIVAGLKVVATALAVAAGLLILKYRAAGRPLAVAALAALAAWQLLVAFTSFFPTNRVPGDDPLYAAGYTLFYGGWIAYLLRSIRVRQTLTE
jgi:hypothetical protein